MKRKIGEILIQCNGAVAGTEEDPTWHIQVIDVAENMQEVKELGGMTRSRVKSMEQCDLEGITLPAAFSSVAADIMRRAERAERSLVEARAVIEKLQITPEEVVPPKKSLLSTLTLGLLK
jgi:hypothetical protein